MSSKNILVTTTSNLDNAEIEKYLQPVTSHEAVGMNIFKDFFSSFSDIFGGSSYSYESTIAKINSRAIEKLKDKVASLGANCIIGLKADTDEISAQGKSMLMVTVVGTAVIAKFENIDKYKERNSKTLSIEGYKINDQKWLYLRKANKGEFMINEEFQDFSNTNNFPEISELLLQQYIREVTTGFPSDETKKRVLNYCHTIDSEDVKGVLYQMLMEDEKEKTKTEVVRLIKETNSLDFDRMLTVFSSEDYIAKKELLKLSDGYKENYEIEDIERINKLIDVVANGFEKRVKIGSSRGVLSSQEKEVWICECGQKNKPDRSSCSRCERDQYGFKPSDIKPDKAIKYLNHIKEVLEQTFK